MKRVIFTIILLSQIIISCDFERESNESNDREITKITKAEDREDLKSEKNMRIEGEKFLNEMELKQGVIKTNSGLLYEILEKGDEKKPTLSNTVKVNYRGKFIDDEIFDSTDGKEPIEFGLDQVIPGWTEGLQLMSIGAKYRFYIPYQLAYGPQGRSGVIPPFSVLIFEVELIDFK